MTRRPHRPARRQTALVGLVAAATLSAVLGACSSPDDTDNASDEPTVETSAPEPSVETTEPTPTEPTETPTLSPTPTSEAPAPSTEPTRTTEPAPALTTRLLPARAVVGLNESWRWRDGETQTTEPTGGTLADCVRFTLTAIGASEVVTRSYLPPADAAGSRASALQVVADFPDAQTAVRVMEVLRSWHGSCQRRLNNVSDRPHRVSEMERVSAGDDAFAYLHTTPGSTKDTTLFEDVGQVRVGHYLSLVVVRLDEQDYNYEPQRTPAARSLTPAAARLG